MCSSRMMQRLGNKVDLASLRNTPVSSERAGKAENS